jgi:hypothetical protein
MPSSNVTLYAQWTPVVPTTYPVIYNGNGNNPGTNPPTDLSSPYAGGSIVTVLGNSGSPVLAKTGYQFAGWNTAADGSGTNYVGGNTFTINATTTLYAQWLIAGSARLVYNGNGASNTTATPSSSGTSYNSFSTQPVVGNTGGFINGLLAFGGWNTLANGSGTSYPPGSTITMPGAGTTTLYAQWIAASPASIPLTYNANGGSGADVTNNYNQNSTATISGNPSFTNGALVFYGWNTASDGSGTSYPAGSFITMNSSKTLYAQWGDTPSLTVTYNANGATGGSVPAGPTNYSSSVQVPILGNTGSLVKTGNTFLGWNSAPDGTGSSYVPGFTFTSKTATLYAQWAPGSTVKFCGYGSFGGTAGTPSVAIYYFVSAQIIQSSDTITIYATALSSSTQSNYGTGTGPLGMTSITSKTVITSSNITINTNTSYSVSSNDNNYSKTIINGVDSNYWPTSPTLADILNITYAAQSSINSSSIPTYNMSTKFCSSSGCGLSVSAGSSGSAVTSYSFYNQCFTINFSDGSSTFIANSPTNVLYTASTSPVNWVTAPKTSYPYGNVLNNLGNIQESYDALTGITIRPSPPGSTTYVSPSMPNFTVQFDPNGATSGSIPVPRYFLPYNTDLGAPTFPYTVPGNTGSLTKSTAPFTFSRWNTAADGTGTDYGPGTANLAYPGGASIILYAIWV